MRPYLSLVALGGAATTVALLLGGGAAALGGLAALAAQLSAVALLRPAMRGPQPAFLVRWLGGMAIRAVTLGTVLTLAATHRALLDPLRTSLGFLGVLLPLLFLETRFLR